MSLITDLTTQVASTVADVRAKNTNLDTTVTTSTGNAETATTAATNAQASADTAAARAQAAADNAAPATQSASAASGSATAASNSESTAASHLTTATQKATLATNRANDATNSAAAALASKTTAAAQVSLASTQATNATTKANTATTKASEAAASATTASGYATTAAGHSTSTLAIYATQTAMQAGISTATTQATAAATSATSASSALTQNLGGVTAAALHRSPNAVTAMFVYDTSKDSDGGAWTERCQHTSWFNEPLCGKWLGAQSSETFARFSGATLTSLNKTLANFISNTYLNKPQAYLAIASNTLTITYNLGSPGWVYVEMSGLTAGRVYRINATTSGSIGHLRIGTDAGIGTDYSALPAYFTATATTMYFSVGLYSGVATIADFQASEVTTSSTIAGDYFQLTTDGKFYSLSKNLLTSTATLATQTQWLTAGTYTFSSTTASSGSVAISGAATASHTAGGAATTFTVAASGNVTFTVTGSVTTAQCEAGSAATAYSANGTSRVTEVFRGNKAKFPKVAAIVGEASNVNIYDLTEPGRPLWMRVVTPLIAGNVSGVAALNSVVGVSTNGTESFTLLKYANDAVVRNRSYGQSCYGAGGIGQRNSWPGWYGPELVLLGAAVQSNAVAMTATADAPADPHTGLKIPTIAVATNEGVRVIRHNGTLGAAGSGNFTKVTLTPQLLSAAKADSTWYYAANPGSLANGFTLSTKTSSSGPDFSNGNTTSLISTSRQDYLRAPSSAVVQRLRNKESAVAGGLAATITNTYNTGWMTGDVRRAYCADVGAGSVSGAELVTSTSQWTLAWPASTTTINSANSITYADDASGYTRTSYFTGLTVGKQYRVTFTSNQTKNIGGGWQVYANGASLGEIATSGTNSFVFTYSTNFYFNVHAYTNGTVSNISIVEVLSNRSYKSALYAITGTLTRTPVATNSQLVAYSGFSASNYLREPYSTDLDFGTGEWSVGSWANIPASLPTSSFPWDGADKVVNGTFSSGTNNWTPFNGSISASNNELTVTGTTDGLAGRAYQSFTTVVGKTYKASCVARGVSGSYAGFSIGIDYTGPFLVGNSTDSANPTLLEGYFTATATTTYIRLSPASGLGNSAVFSSVSVRESGVSSLLSRSYSTGPRITLGVVSPGTLTATASDGTTTRTVTTSSAYNTATWLKAEATYRAGKLAILVNGQEVASSVGAPLAPHYGRKNLFDYTQEFAASYWYANGGAAKVSTAVADPLGGSNAVELSFSSMFAHFGTSGTFTPIAGQTYTLSYWARRDSGTNTLSVYTGNGNGLGSFTPTSTWTRYSFTFSWPSGGAGLLVCQDRNGSGFTNVQLFGMQLEPGSTATDYVKTVGITPSDGHPLTIGNSYSLDAPFPGSIALLKLSATVPTTEQALFAYEQEKQLFRDGAQCCLPDSGSIVDLAYDDATDSWSAISASNESTWTGLVRTNVTPVSAGSYIKTAATSGIKLTARDTTNKGVDVTLPSVGLREEIAKKNAASSSKAKNVTVYDFDSVTFTGNTTSGSATLLSVSSVTGLTVGMKITGSGIPTDTTILGIEVVSANNHKLYLSANATATANGVTMGQADFVLPVGMTALAAFVNGAEKRKGATDGYSLLFDGFRETVRFATSPGATWIQVHATREVA